MKMLFSLKYFSFQVLVIFGLLASTNIFACTPEKSLNENNSDSDSLLLSIQKKKLTHFSISTPSKNQAHQHAQISGSSNFGSEQHTLHKSCECCEYCDCVSCVGCSVPCGTAIISAPSNSEPIHATLACFARRQGIYASVFTIPLEHPPK